MRFEASYYPGEVDERLPEWRVVEWTYVNTETGAKSGRSVFRTYDLENGEREAKELAGYLQDAYNLEVYNECV